MHLFDDPLGVKCIFKMQFQADDIGRMTVKYLLLEVLTGECGQLPVVLGSAPAKDLCELSFADVLDEATGRGYQRPMDTQHSRGFREYIESSRATTIPLTFNLRGPEGEAWTLDRAGNGRSALLRIRRPDDFFAPVLARVDCQHRLGMMADSPIALTFQCFLGLSAEEEMAIFNVINGKAKGLSSSLLDYHTTVLTPDLAAIHVELHIAKKLNDDPGSVWHAKVKLGGVATQGTSRRISLRGLQAATKMLLQRCPLEAGSQLGPEQLYEIVRDFWAAVASVWPVAWSQPRTHLLAKGVGVTALSMLGGDVVTSLLSRQQPINQQTFAAFLAPLSNVDWSTGGTFKGFGGRHGANEAHQVLRGQLFAPGLAMARTGR